MGPIAHLINDNLVEMLSKRLYPEKLTVMAKTDLLTDEKRRQAVSYIESCKEYEAELSQLSETALLALAEDEISQDKQRQKELAEEEESNRYFYDRSSRADFSVWMKRETWTVDQATALLLGKNPDIVDWPSVNPLVYKSRFAKRYSDLRAHVKGALEAGRIDKSSTPAAFLRYASSIGFVLPADMQIVLMPSKVRTGSQNEDGLDEDRGAVSSFRQLIESKKQKEGLAAEPVDTQPEPAMPESTPDSERLVLLKMLGAMAEGRYGFDPGSADMDATSEIVSDLKSAGINANPVSVHKLICDAVRLNHR